VNFLETSKTKKEHVHAHCCIMHGSGNTAGLCDSAAVAELNQKKSRPERDGIFVMQLSIG